MTIQYDGPDQDSFEAMSSGAQEQSSTENFTQTYDSGSGPYGEYEIKAEVYSSTDLLDDTESRTFTLDGTVPEVTTSQDYVSDGGELTLTVNDEFTEVEELNVTDDESEDLVDEEFTPNCDAGDSCDVQVDIDTGDMNDGDNLDLEYNVTDAVGNKDTGQQIDVEVDNSYEGDTDPDVSVEDADEDNNIVVEGSLEKDIDVELEEADELSDIRVRCYVDGDEIHETGFESVGEDGQEYTCDFDTSDYSGETVDLSVEMCDEAGNCEDTDLGEYTVDMEDPEVTEFETVDEFNVFNSDFEASFQAEDDASGVEEVRYFFDPATPQGDGIQVSRDGDDQFTVDTSGLERGENTVYLRARDAVDRWSSLESLEFEYYPDTSPQLSIESPGNLSVVAENPESVEVTVSNPGKLYVESATLSMSVGDFFSREQDLEGIEPGDSITTVFELNFTEDEIGNHTWVLETEQPSDSVSSGILVEANQDQEQDIEERVSNYSERLESLEENISELRSKGLSESLNRSLSSNVSDFVSQVRSAQEFVDQGKHYRALSALEGVDQEYEVASQTFQEVDRQHSINERNTILAIAGAMVFLVVLGGGVYLVSSDEYGLDLSEYKVPEFGGVTGAVSEKIDQVQEMIQKEEEEAEQKFQGFS